MFNEYTRVFRFDDGKELKISTGKYARQADGAVMLTMGKTMLFASVVSPKEPREGADFLPLTVDYQEKFAASGRIPGGFNKREARLSNYEILISRLCDRSIRPLFPDDYYSEIQVMVYLVSSDENILPDSLVAVAVSSAITLSDIPFNGPVAQVRVARIDGELKINPYKDELERADINIIVAGTEKDLNMVEGEMKEVSEQEMIEALKFAHESIKKLCRFQKEMAEEAGKPKRPFSPVEENEDIYNKVKNHFSDKIREIALKPTAKQERTQLFNQLWNEYHAQLSEEELEHLFYHKRYFEKVKKSVIREVILEKGIRLDGRKTHEIRPIYCEVDCLPAAHGSALFTRGETQSLTTVTLGSKLDEQMVDGAVFQGYDKFILHYNFPPFSTGEVRPNRGPGRREIGHGALAKRALEAVMPSEDENPYTVRVVSDILESNGSSSMATVCAGTLALMDAGIKIKAPVSGIAMGLIIDNESGKYAILSDILGDEDHLGDMDFKVTGTEKGITACQMDIKIDGLSYTILEEALNQAKDGRLHILEKMKAVISEPRPDYKPHAPRIVRFEIDSDMVGAVIGTGGKTIQEIQSETGTIITIDQDEEGKAIVEVSSNDKESMNTAIEWIKGLVQKPEIGKVYKAKVKSVVDFGAFLEFLPNHEGLLHNSEYSWNRNEVTNRMVKKGDIIEVKLISIDRRTGKAKLSRKALLKREYPPSNRPRTSQRRRP